MVSQFDGTPVTDTSNQVIVQKSHSYNYVQNTTETKHTLNANGMFEYTTVVNDRNGFTLKVCDDSSYLLQCKLHHFYFRPFIWMPKKGSAGYRRLSQKPAPICWLF